MGKGKGKKKQLTGMAAALAKAGVMNEKNARKAQREARREERQLGEEGVARRRAEELAEIERKKDEAAAAQRDESAKELEAKVAELIEAHVVAGWQGRRRWFYLDGEQVLPIEVSDEVARLLKEGQAAIVRAAEEGKTLIVRDPDVLGRIAVTAKERLLFWNKLGAS